MRPSGMAASSCASLAESVIVLRLIGVATAPGPTPTTRILWLASSRPAVRVSMRMPPLGGQEAVLPGIGQSSCTGGIFVVGPPPPPLINCLGAVLRPEDRRLRVVALTLC